MILNIADLNAISTVGILGVSGQAGATNGHFNYPSGVAVDPWSDRILVADSNNSRIQVFRLSTLAYDQTIGAGTWVEDVAVDGGGRVYFSEPWSGNQLVRQLSPVFEPRRIYGVERIGYLTDAGHFNEPSAMAVLPDGGLIVGEEAGRRLLALNPDGSLRWQIGEAGYWGNNNAQFTYVNDAAVDPQGRIYVTDEANHRVQIYTSLGQYVATIGGSYGTGNDQFNRPQGVGIGPDGKIYVADTQNYRVQVYDANRNYVATIGRTGQPTDANDGFRWPRDVAVDSRGYIYVSDVDNSRVQVFGPDRTYLRTMGQTYEHDSFNGPHSVLIGPEDRVYVADTWNNRVQVFDRDGAYITTVGGNWGTRTGELRSPHGIALDKDGNVYVADWDNHRVQKFAGRPRLEAGQRQRLRGYLALPCADHEVFQRRALHGHGLEFGRRHAVPVLSRAVDPGERQRAWRSAQRGDRVAAGVRRQTLRGHERLADRRRAERRGGPPLF